MNCGKGFRAIWILVFFTLFSAFVLAADCTDSDSKLPYAQTYAVQGTTAVGSNIQNDYCLQDGRLAEFYCDTPDSLMVDYHTCQKGCENGACVCPQYASLYCPNGKVYCTIPESIDSDGCPKPPQNCSCIPSTVCTDSDGGKNYFVKGFTAGATREGGYATSYDSCLGNSLQEWYCDGNYIANAPETYQCFYGCNEGACVSANCIGEGGSIPVIPNPPLCCAGLALIKPKEQNLLGSYGICTAKCGNGVCDSATESAYNCPQDCAGPAKTCDQLLSDSSASYYFNLCAQEGYGFVCFNKYNSEYQGCTKDPKVWNDCTQQNENAAQNILCPAQTVSTCTDSDGGKNEFVAGKTYIDPRQGVYYDACDGSQLTEYYCSFDSNTKQPFIKRDSIACSMGCANGACFNEPRVCAAYFRPAGSTEMIQGTWTDAASATSSISACLDYMKQNILDKPYCAQPQNADYLVVLLIAKSKHSYYMPQYDGSEFVYGGYCPTGQTQNKPDLAIAMVTGTTPKVGETYLMGFVIKNIGAVASGATDFILTWSDSQYTVIQKLPVLQPGEATSITTTRYFGSSGKYSYKAKADYSNYVDESNEENNVVSGELSVSGDALNAYCWTEKTTYTVKELEASGGIVNLLAKVVDSDGTPATPEEGTSVLYSLVFGSAPNSNLPPGAYKGMSFNPYSMYYEAKAQVPPVVCVNAPCDSYASGMYLVEVLASKSTEGALLKASAHCKFEVVSRNQSCTCPTVYSPVCGWDGKTYPNACVAKCSGAAIKHEGECKKPCPAEFECCSADDKFYEEKPCRILEKTSYPSYRYAKWTCYDGSSEKQGSETSCKPEQLWRTYAENSCKGKCSNNKCGVDSFSVGVECGGGSSVFQCVNHKCVSTPTPTPVPYCSAPNECLTKSEAARRGCTIVSNQVCPQQISSRCAAEAVRAEATPTQVETGTNAATGTATVSAPRCVIPEQTACYYCPSSCEESCRTKCREVPNYEYNACYDNCISLCQPPQPPEEYKKFILKLMPGWNLFAAPLADPNNPEQIGQVTNLDEVKKCLEGYETQYAIYYYDAVQKKYVALQGTPKVGVGYWIRMPSACKLEITGIDFNVDGTKLYAGWNIIGGPSKDVKWDSIKGTCNAVSGPWEYLAPEKKYSRENVLKQGKGYFVKVSQECQLAEYLTIEPTATVEPIPAPPGESSSASITGALIAKIIGKK